MAKILMKASICREALLRAGNRAIAVDASKVSVLDSPTEFYETLIGQIERSRRRVTLASLYLGTGEKEQRLVRALDTRMAALPELRATVLLDHNRGLRRGRGGEPSSADMFAPLKREHGAAADVCFYLMPQLRDSLTFIPSKWRRGLMEGQAVQHLKAYVFDDTVVMSGANLSDDYFTNRQDRYVVFEDAPELAEHYHSLVRSLVPFSHELSLDALDAPKESEVRRRPVAPPRVSDTVAETSALESCLRRSDARHEASSAAAVVRAADDPRTALVFPTVQQPSLLLRNDEAVTAALLRVASETTSDAPAAAHVDISSGYLNLHSGYSDLLVNGQSAVRILTASPRANGFYGARGIAGALPLAYSLIEQQFMKKCARAARYGGESGVRLYEYTRPQWTFHGKGLWLSSTSSGSTSGSGGAEEEEEEEEEVDQADQAKAEAEAVGDCLPFCTVVGSPNLGRRSVDRDLESAVVLLTRHPGLQHALAEERRRLFEVHTETIDDAVFERPDRKIGPQILGWANGNWIRVAMPILQPYF